MFRIFYRYLIAGPSCDIDFFIYPTFSRVYLLFPVNNAHAFNVVIPKMPAAIIPRFFGCIHVKTYFPKKSLFTLTSARNLNNNYLICDNIQFQVPRQY